MTPSGIYNRFPRQPGDPPRRSRHVEVASDAPHLRDVAARMRIGRSFAFPSAEATKLVGLAEEMERQAVTAVQILLQLEAGQGSARLNMALRALLADVAFRGRTPE